MIFFLIKEKKHSNDDDISRLNLTKLDEAGDPKGMRKCSLHPKFDGKKIKILKNDNI